MSEDEQGALLFRYGLGENSEASRSSIMGIPIKVFSETICMRTARMWAQIRLHQVAYLWRMYISLCLNVEWEVQHTVGVKMNWYP